MSLVLLHIVFACIHQFWCIKSRFCNGLAWNTEMGVRDNDCDGHFMLHVINRPDYIGNWLPLLLLLAYKNWPWTSLNAVHFGLLTWMTEKPFVRLMAPFNLAFRTFGRFSKQMHNCTLAICKESQREGENNRTLTNACGERNIKRQKKNTHVPPNSVATTNRIVKFTHNFSIYSQWKKKPHQRLQQPKSTLK